MFGFEHSKRIVHNDFEKLGLKKDSEDDRDHINNLSASLEKKDLKQYASFVKQQGSMQSCTAHAAMLVYEMEQRINNKRWQIEGSEQHNYYYSRILSGLFPGDKGSYLRDACKVMNRIGVCPEKLMPYIDTNPNYPPRIFADSFAKFWRIKEYVRQASLESIKQSIEDEHPVLLGIPTYNGWFGLKEANIPLPTGRSRGGHAITIIGYDDRRKAFHIQNSWGARWGKFGRAWLPYEYFDMIPWWDAWAVKT